MAVEDLWRLFDIIGTACLCGVGGNGRHPRRMDIFGSVLAPATAVGGGVRDASSRPCRRWQAGAIRQLLLSWWRSQRHSFSTSGWRCNRIKPPL